MSKLWLAATALVLVSAAQAYDGEQFVTCNLDQNGDNWVALKAGPDLGAARLGKLGPGTFLITLEPYAEGMWRQVIVQKDIQDWSYSGPQGWVYTDYICEVVY